MKTKKVYEIGSHLFWASNSQEVLKVHYREWDGDKVWLNRFGRPRIQIEMVEPPAGRCPHCGEKL